MKLVKTLREYMHNKPKIRKTLGIVLVIVGLVALITPLTPGSWLALIGLELLGWRILFYDPLRRRLSGASKLKFWKKKQDPNSSNLPAGR